MRARADAGRPTPGAMGLLAADLSAWAAAIAGVGIGTTEPVVGVALLVGAVAWAIAGRTRRRARRAGIEASGWIDASPHRVWTLYEPFGDGAVWHPMLQSSHRVEGTPDTGVGAVRECHFGPRMTVREEILERPADGLVIGVDMVRGPAPPTPHCAARVVIEPEGDGTRLTLQMEWQTGLGVLGQLLDAFVLPAQNRATFEQVVAAATAYAETGEPVPQVAMPMSGRQLA